MKNNQEQSWPASRVELWPIDKIVPYDKNPRTHPQAQIDLIANSMKSDGVTAPILVDEKGVIIYGHGRRLAAIQNGFEKYPVAVAKGWTEKKKNAARIKDNSYGLMSGWDDGLIQAALAQLKLEEYPLELLGFTDFQLDQIMAPIMPVEPEPEVIPNLPKNPITKKGDLWLLGPHRILCGDCRESFDVDRLMEEAVINVGFTSPPYAEQRQYDEKSGFRPIPPDEYVEWFKPVAANVAKHLAPDGSWFINIKPSADGLDTDLYVFDLVLAHAREWGWHFATEYCWERNGVPKSVTRRFKNQFEPIYQFARGEWKMRPKSVMHKSENVPIPFGEGAGQTSWKSAQGGNGPMFGAAAGRFNARDVKRKRGFPTGESNQGTNWQSGAPRGVPQDQIVPGMAYPGNRLPTFAASHEATGHAAAFPVGLPGFFVLAYSDAGDAIYDPFLGSGSTLIAAERHGRVGYGMEISAAYVDVCVERWERLTGHKATREKAASSRRRPLQSKSADHVSIR